MLRSSRQLLRLAPRPAAAPSAPASASFSTRASQTALQTFKRPSAALRARPSPLALVARYTNSPYDKIDKQAEAEIARKKLESNPTAVSTESSRRHVFEPAPPNPERDAELAHGLKHDVVRLALPLHLRFETLTTACTRTSSRTPSTSARCPENRSPWVSPEPFPTWRRR